MPGLIRGIVRTAAIVGTAEATRNAVDRHSAEKDMRAQQEAAQSVYGQPAPQQVVYAAPPPQYAPPPPPAPAAAPDTGSDLAAEIQQLAQLHTAGVLTDEEFAAAKAKLLGG